MHIFEYRVDFKKSSCLVKPTPTKGTERCVYFLEVFLVVFFFPAVFFLGYDRLDTVSYSHSQIDEKKQEQQ